MVKNTDNGHHEESYNAHGNTTLMDRINNAARFIKRTSYVSILEALLLFMLAVLSVVQQYFGLHRYQFLPLDSGLRQLLDSPTMVRITDGIDAFMESVILADLAVLILWGFVGAIVYIALWSSLLILRNVNDSFAFMFHYIHPTGYDSKKFWGSILLEKTVFMLRALVLVAVVLLVWGSVIPLYQSDIALALDAPSVGRVIAVGASALLSGIGVHAIVVGFRIVRHIAPDRA